MDRQLIARRLANLAELVTSVVAARRLLDGIVPECDVRPVASEQCVNVATWWAERVCCDAPAFFACGPHHEELLDVGDRECACGETAPLKRLLIWHRIEQGS